MNKQCDNIRIIAINNIGKPGFCVYLDFSGQREFLMWHCHNGLLFNILRDGMSLGMLRRWSPKSKRNSCQDRDRVSKLDGMIKHLLRAADEYIAERSEFLATVAKNDLASTKEPDPEPEHGNEPADSTYP